MYGWMNWGPQWVSWVFGGAVPDTGNDALQMRLLLRACAEAAVVRENGNGNGNGGEGGWQRHTAMDVGMKVYEAVEKKVRSVYARSAWFVGNEGVNLAGRLRWD